MAVLVLELLVLLTEPMRMIRAHLTLDIATATVTVIVTVKVRVEAVILIPTSGAQAGATWVDLPGAATSPQYRPH
jgi:hypothetical protein